MTDSNEIKLGSAQETMLLPLRGRAVETQKQNPVLVDHKRESA
jgi:O-methyltransferase involved in polyketide biosynthesis